MRICRLESNSVDIADIQNIVQSIYNNSKNNNNNNNSNNNNTNNNNSNNNNTNNNNYYYYDYIYIILSFIIVGWLGGFMRWFLWWYLLGLDVCALSLPRAGISHVSQYQLE